MKPNGPTFNGRLCLNQGVPSFLCSANFAVTLSYRSRRRAILGHRGLHERLERARVDLLPFVDVDRPSRVAFQAGIEEARWVWDPGPPGERELHDLRVRLPGADNPVVRPDRSAHPLPLLGHLRVGFQDQRPMRARVSPRHPPRSRIRWSMSRESGFPLAHGSSCLSLLKISSALSLPCLTSGGRKPASREAPVSILRVVAGAQTIATVPD